MVPVSAVYYPQFEPPATWLRAFLLVSDRITTPVPDDVTWQPSPALSQLLEWIPDAVERVPLTENETEPTSATLDALRRAFMVIRDRSPRKQRGSVTIRINENDGTFDIPGYVFLHNRKLSVGI